jgi:hypothetical protein
MTNPKPIDMFVDETFFDSPSGCTGVIQTLFCVPSELNNRLKVECEAILSRNPNAPNEFKGTQAKKQSNKYFEDFGRIYRNLAADSAFRYDLKSFITIDGIAFDDSGDVKHVLSEIQQEFPLEVTPKILKLLKLYAGQLTWLMDHSPAVSGKAIANPVRVYFDNRNLSESNSGGFPFEGRS